MTDLTQAPPYTPWFDATPVRTDTLPEWLQQVFGGEA